MKRTHFGFESIDESDKAKRVSNVFHSVARNYDLMNDLMSVGIHRIWKIFTIIQANVRPGFKILDIAAGTGDLTKAFVRLSGTNGEVWHTDINESMLRVGRDRLINKGILTPSLLCDGEKIPFPDNYFDVVTIAFGLRNMTHKDIALGEMCRVIKPGGCALVLEFSKVCTLLRKAYDIYSFNILPWLGHKFANDDESYLYLAESIRMHPDQDALKIMMEQAGFDFVEYYSLSFGVVALHTGIKY
ncbi:MAG: bifunctional demethylmenaquinone methyltransferase/2-methoxy-6-polyprenyl-1,4-benzoquinol methylase UbiE [Burkholderia sp.]|nr:bifunctional demethylmenaquinone methyltransferase/2-methoxy-6-polyprenyl-1,4-benzoquinol methylase UbiE [Burkholderia sp.]